MIEWERLVVELRAIFTIHLKSKLLIPLPIHSQIPRNISLLMYDILTLSLFSLSPCIEDQKVFFFMTLLPHLIDAHAYKNIIITGNFNCNLLKDNSAAKHLKDFIFSSSLYLVKTKASFHSATCNSWLDAFIIDSKDKLLSFSKSDAPFINGHDLLRLSINLMPLPLIILPLFVEV